MLAPLLTVLALVLVVGGAVMLVKRIERKRARPRPTIVRGGGGVPDAPRRGENQT